MSLFGFCSLTVDEYVAVPFQSQHFIDGPSVATGFAWHAEVSVVIDATQHADFQSVQRFSDEVRAQYRLVNTRSPVTVQVSTLIRKAGQVFADRYVKGCLCAALVVIFTIQHQLVHQMSIAY